MIHNENLLYGVEDYKWNVKIVNGKATKANSKTTNKDKCVHNRSTGMGKKKEVVMSYIIYVWEMLFSLMKEMDTVYELMPEKACTSLKTKN